MLETGLLQDSDRSRIRQVRGGEHGAHARRGERERRDGTGGLGGVAATTPGRHDPVTDLDGSSAGGQNMPIEPTTVVLSRSMIKR